MKRISYLILGLFLVSFAAPLAFAESQDAAELSNSMIERMEKKDGKDWKKGKMGMPHQPTMIATSDGGVIVLSGPKLAKYDKDLNLIKEVELKGGPKPGEKKGEERHPTETEPVQNAEAQTPPAQ